MKIAVFISGPPRYIVNVIEQLKVILFEYEYDIFIHVWKRDSGNKVRINENKNWLKVKNDVRIKSFIVQEPYTEDYVKELGYSSSTRVGKGNIPASSINATFGMFTAIRILINNLESLPERDEYTHILRLRTDNIFYNRDTMKKIDFSENVINTAQNHRLGVHRPRISDHIWLSSKECFMKCWNHPFSYIYKIYTKADRSPEITLAKLARKWIPHSKIHRNILRSYDYDVVYYPSNPNDPVWVRSILEEEGLESLYRKAFEFVKTEESRRVIDRHRELLDKREKAKKIMYKTRKKMKSIMRRIEKIIRESKRKGSE